MSYDYFTVYFRHIVKDDNDTECNIRINCDLKSLLKVHTNLK